MDPADFAVRAVAFDTETHLIQTGLLAPPLVCASIASVNNSRLLDKQQALDYFRRLLNSNAIIVGANVAFDALVMAVYAAKQGTDLVPSIFRAYKEGRIFDVQVAEALHAIGLG